MTRFAEFSLQPGVVIAWLIVGLIAGWAVGHMMKGGGYGPTGDIIAGVIGGAIGGFVYALSIPGDAGFWGSLVVAFCGACFFIFSARYVARIGTRP